jgi:hypothetical protein
MEDGEASHLLVSHFTSYKAHLDYSLTLRRDAFTTSSDFIISPHAGAKGLYVATCGSFHGYKFFPVLGKYVIQMLEGDLTPELKEKWAWDRERPAPSLNPDWPRWEMNDLLDQWPKAKL